MLREEYQHDDEDGDTDDEATEAAWDAHLDKLAYCLDKIHLINTCEKGSEIELMTKELTAPFEQMEEHLNRAVSKMNKPSLLREKLERFEQIAPDRITPSILALKAAVNADPRARTPHAQSSAAPSAPSAGGAGSSTLDDADDNWDFGNLSDAEAAALAAELSEIN